MVPGPGLGLEREQGREQEQERVKGDSRAINEWTRKRSYPGVKGRLGVDVGVVVVVVCVKESRIAERNRIRGGSREDGRMWEVVWRR